MSKSERASSQSLPQSVSMRVVQRIAETEGVASADLDPLYEAVDPDALEALVASADPDLSIRLTVYGHRIEIDGTGEVRVE